MESRVSLSAHAVADFAKNIGSMPNSYIADYLADYLRFRHPEEEFKALSTIKQLLRDDMVD